MSYRPPFHTVSLSLPTNTPVAFIDSTINRLSKSPHPIFRHHLQPACELLNAHGNIACINSDSIDYLCYISARWQCGGKLQATSTCAMRCFDVAKSYYVHISGCPPLMLKIGKRSYDVCGLCLELLYTTQRLQATESGGGK